MMTVARRSTVHRWFDRHEHDEWLDIVACMIQATAARIISPRIACGGFAWHDWRDGRCVWCGCSIYREVGQ
jgi:hypothetical protein